MNKDSIQKMQRSQHIKHLCISSLIVIILAIGIGWYPYILSYQDKVYKTDRAKYDAEKSQWDSIQTINFKKAEDSVFNYWIAHNDTSLKTIKKISKHLTYGTTGYYKNTGKWECELPSTYSTKLVCEPMKEWVTTDYYVDGYYYDTTWTDGYNNRNEWLNKARNIAHVEAIKHKVEFRPYDGHEYHYIIKVDSSLARFGERCSLICGLAAIFGLGYFLMAILRLEPNKDNYESCTLTVVQVGVVLGTILGLTHII